MVLEQARAALAALYTSPNEEERRAADAWLRGFATQEGAWHRLLALLADPAAAEHERFYAATSLRPLAQRQKEPVQPDAAPAAAQLLAHQYAAAAAAGAWAVANPLAGCLAAVAVRSQSWPAEQLVPQLLSLLHSALQAVKGTAGSSSSSQLAAAVHLLSALAEAACSLDTGMHPQRREAAKAALAAAPEPLAAVQQALAAGGKAQMQAAALQLVQAWCALGPPPAGTEAASELLQQMHLAALDPGLGSAAAEAVAALYISCCCEPRGGGGSDGTGTDGSSEQRRQQLLGTLCGLLPSFASALQQALGEAHGSSGQQARLLNGALGILGAAAKAADSQGQLGPPTEQQVASNTVQLAADVALAAMQQPQFDVVLAALQHWDEQLERWKAASCGGSGSGAACSPQQQQALVGQLCSSLLQRMTLPAQLPSACLTADARDLPDAVQQVRREVADTFRAATECLGVPAARQQLLQLAQQAQAAWQRGGSWQEYECGLYALNLVWAKQRSAQPGAVCVAEARQASALVAAALQPGLPKLAGTALTLLGGMAEQLPLLEASRQEQPALQQHHQQQQQPQSQQPLQHLLSLLVQLLQQAHDDKLSRNAATCCSRLAAHRPLAALLVARHPSWSDALCACFATASSQQPQHAQHGEDQPTSHFLLSAICHLAAAGAEAGPPAENGQEAAAAASQHGSQLLLQLLSQPAAAAEAALAAAAAALDAELRQQQLGQAAVHVQTIAVALEAAAGSSTSDGSGSQEFRRNGLAEQLPIVLASLAGVLQQAVAAAAAAASAQLPGEPLLLQALCRVAAATAPTPAAVAGLQLLQPFAAAPQHPCILLALTATAGSTCLQDSMPQLQHSVSACIQAAAAQHAGDPDWQPALLQLGEACLVHLPAVAADAAALDALLGAAQHGMRSYHRTVCEQAVSFAEALCCAGSCAATATGAGHGPAAASARHQLQRRLDGGGLGAALVLGLLLAAAGAMPPYMIIAIADALHRTWRAVGYDRFGAWLRGAALESAPEDAPWRRWKPEAQQAAVADLLSPQCAQDARRFKRLLKVLTGGKKKGQRVDQPARGA